MELVINKLKNKGVQLDPKIQRLNRLRNKKLKTTSSSNVGKKSALAVNDRW